jgi:uncharacterized protein (TIGR02001 family)
MIKISGTHPAYKFMQKIHFVINLKKGNIMLHSKLLNTLILAALVAPGIAMAEDAPAAAPAFTSNVGLVSDYLYRGISQTGGKPAIQGGFDYAHTSGFYAGVWGSSISWLIDSPTITGATSSQLELDTYLGFKNSFAEDFSYDVGYLRYNYPASYTATLPAGAAKADTDEIYGALGYKFVTAKYSYGLGNVFGIDKSKGTTYLDVTATYPVADSGFTLIAHAGKQTYKGSVADGLAAGGSTPTYSDYKLGVTKDFGGFVFGLAYSNTNANKLQYTNTPGKFLGKNTTVLSLTRAF